MKTLIRMLVLALLLTCGGASAQQGQVDPAHRLHTNIFEIMGIRGETWAVAQAGIARGEKWRRHGWANRYLFVNRARQWPYDVTADDRAGSDWHQYED